jgi:hypothetical protein
MSWRGSHSDAFAVSIVNRFHILDQSYNRDDKLLTSCDLCAL